MFLAFLGVQAGRILGLKYDIHFCSYSIFYSFSAIYQNDVERLTRFFTWSIVSTAIGVGLTAGTLDGGPMPLNKNIWTLSFSFFTGKRIGYLIPMKIIFSFVFSWFSICWFCNHVHSYRYV
jgi:hypothetical protein